MEISEGGERLAFRLADDGGSQAEPTQGGVGALEIALVDACKVGRFAKAVLGSGGESVKLSEKWMAKLAQASASEWKSREDLVNEAAKSAAQEAWPQLVALEERSVLEAAAQSGAKGSALRM